MLLLKHLLSEEFGQEDEPTDRLTEFEVDTIKKNIRDGVKPDPDTGQFQPWANALHLVHKAYEVAGIERPKPQMKEMWKQYETIISYAVEQLASTRGNDGKWRMSAAPSK